MYESQAKSKGSTTLYSSSLSEDVSYGLYEATVLAPRLNSQTEQQT